jgi:GT2 family glycosyltransferase
MSVRELRLARANTLFRDRNYEAAMELYLQIASQGGTWAKVVARNVELCRRRLKLSVDEIDERTNEQPVRRKVLITDFRYPRFDMSAGELATYGVIEMFRRLGFDVIFVPKESTELDARYITALRNLGVQCIDNVSYSTFTRIVAELAADISVAYLFRPDVAEICLSAIRGVNPNATIVYHAPDVYFRRERGKFEVESSTAEVGSRDRESAVAATAVKEVNIAAISDHVICVSRGDSDALTQAFFDKTVTRSTAEPPPVWTLPLLYLKEAEALPSFEGTRNICFIGGSEHSPNRDALQWFLQSVWGKLRNSIPGIEFHVIGKTLESEKALYESFEGVVVRGWVESLAEAMRAYRLSVAPLRYGAGIKGKVGLSAICGVPCVASSVALEDMGLTPDEDVFCAVTPAEYVEAIRILYGDKKKWEKISVTGARKASQLYSETSTFKHFLSLLNNAGILDTEIYCQFIRNESRGSSEVKFARHSGRPDVSVIVPGYNNARITTSCLTSIYWSIQPTSSLSIEVIYGDDCSDPKVCESIKKKFPTVNVTKTAVNLGFVGNCNHSAASATGRYIALLNNDTIVLPGWLDGLTDLLDRSERCYVAGSKLLYANGRIQEAGASIWTDARTCSVGRGPDGDGLDSTAEQYNYIREVDYVSFASVLVRKDFWDQVGGLGREYGLGYFDDSDFCMKVRKSGGVVLYAPASEVIHNESASFSKKNRKIVAAQQELNAGLFRKTWQDELIKRHLAYDFPAWDVGYGESISKAKSERHRIITKMSDNSRRHILFFSPFPSHPANHGNQATIKEFASFLKSEGYAVHFVLLASHMYSENDVAAMRASWDSLDIIKCAHFPSCDGKEIRFDGWYLPGLGEKVSLLCSKYDVDTIICSYIFQSRILDYVPSYILKIIDTHDKFTNRYSILDALGRPREFFSCSAKQEADYLSRADVVLARRDEEREYFDSICRGKVFTVPHLERARGLEKGVRDLAVVGMIASCNHVNLEIVVSTLAELIRQRAAGWGFVIHVAGEVRSLLSENDPLHRQILEHPEIRFLGFVENIEDFYRDVDLVICPVMSGTGINVKTVQALAFGMPLLSTSHAAKGVPTQDSNHQFVEVAGLIRHLLAGGFTHRVLTEMARKSRGIFERLSASGYDNFRAALALTQPELRREVGQSLTIAVPARLATKAQMIGYVKGRRPRLLRKEMVAAIVKSLEAFGPTWLNLNQALPNIQPDGGVGFYFRFRTAITKSAELFIVMGNTAVRLHRSNDSKLFTASVNTSLLQIPGDLALNLRVVFEWDLAGRLEEPVPFATLPLVRA